ncbi:hypothetical protein P9112_008114 [Eukaryota sp. TZLM1-RC]
MFFEVDPLYLRFMMEGKVIAEWQSFYGCRTNVLGNNPSDYEIWEYLLLSTQLNPRLSSRPNHSEQWCSLCKTNKHPEEKCFTIVGRPGSKKRQGGEKRDRKRSNSSSSNNNKSDEYTSLNNNLTNNSINSIYKMSNADSNYKHLNPLKRFRESSNPVGSIHSVRLFRVTGDQVSSNGELWLTCSINNLEVQGEIDNGAAFSVLSMNLASKCNMTVNDNKTVEYLSANGIRSTTLECASGVLALNVGRLATQVILGIELQIIPGTNNFLIGKDLLQTLGLRTEHGFNINLDREHRTILNAECEFDNRICQPITFIEQLSNKSD